jgi:hypothetical protein
MADIKMADLGKLHAARIKARMAFYMDWSTNYHLSTVILF